MTYAAPAKVNDASITVAGYTVRGEEGFAQWAAAKDPRDRDTLLGLMLRWARRKHEL